MAEKVNYHTQTKLLLQKQLETAKEITMSPKHQYFKTDNSWDIITANDIQLEVLFGTGVVKDSEYGILIRILQNNRLGGTAYESSGRDEVEEWKNLLEKNQQRIIESKNYNKAKIKFEALKQLLNTRIK